MFHVDVSPMRVPRAPIPISEIDFVLTTQFVVAWAGEGGEEKRLGWWRSDLVSPYGGKDLFRRLLPSTWEWAVLQGALEAARRRDAELRRQDHNADRILSLFNFGFELDERIEERLQDLKRSGRRPYDAMPALSNGIEPAWNREWFHDWIRGHGAAEVVTTPTGRRVRGNPSTSLDQLARQLVAALDPLVDNYPLPHFTRSV
jgi:hypothetical protein